MTRLQQFQYEVDQITKKMIRDNMPEPKRLAIEVCWNLSESEYTGSWTHHICLSGLQNKFISELGMEKCKKSEAHILLVIGERPEFLKDAGAGAYGNWQKGVKNIWLRPIVKK